MVYHAFVLTEWRIGVAPNAAPLRAVPGTREQRMVSRLPAMAHFAPEAIIRWTAIGPRMEASHCVC